MSNAAFDCPPSVSYNPKRPSDYRIRTKSFGSVANPIEEEMKDIDQVRKSYALLPLVSFFDNSDATLQFFRQMKEGSPTHGSCIGDIGRYVLGGEIVLTRRKEEGLYLDDFNTGLTTTEKDLMLQFIKSLNPTMTRRGFLHLFEIAKAIYQNKKVYGNSFIRVNMVQVGRSKYVYIDNIDCEKCRYWATLPTEPKVLAVSPLWNYDYLMRHPPELVGVYPNFTENKVTGVISTIIHDFEKVVGRDWYGQPDSIMSLYWQYAETQQGQYFTEGFASDFTGRVAMEYVGDDDRDREDFENAVEETFTNKAGADKKRIVMRMRRPEDTPMTIHEFSANTEHEFHGGVSELSENAIIKSHSWNKILMGVPVAGKLGLGSEFWDIYEIKNFNLINPIRHATMQSINTALSIAEEFLTGKTTITDTVSLGLFDVYQNLINQKKK